MSSTYLLYITSLNSRGDFSSQRISCTHKNILLKVDLSAEPIATPSLTDFYIKKYLNNLSVKKKVYLLAPKRQLTCVLTFFGKKSLKLRSRLVNSVDKTVRFCNLKVVFRSQRRLNFLFWFKDTLNKKIRSFLVYRYT